MCQGTARIINLILVPPLSVVLDSDFISTHPDAEIKYGASKGKQKETSDLLRTT